MAGMGAVIDHWRGKDFEDHLAKEMDKTNNQLTRESFEELHKEFAHLNSLALYSVSGWVSMRYPGLEGALRSGNWDNWVAAR